MSDSNEKSLTANKTRRWIVFGLIVLASAIQLYRITHVRSNTGETPFLSANDRSRWCTILAITANGSYEIDDIIEIRDEETNRRTWYTIDMVQHRGPDGKQHFYSSKPPLLPTMYAGVYWLVRNTTGLSLLNEPFEAAQIILLIVNFLPMLGLWWLMMRWTDRANLDDWQFGILAVLATFGTFLSTFIVTLNNHTPGAISAAVSLWAAERIVVRRDLRSGWFILAGFATSFAAANELPALLWLVIVAGLLFMMDYRKTVLFHVTAMLPVAFAFFATNYIAHGTWRPAYSQRAVGALITTMDLPSDGEDLSQMQTSPIMEKLRPLGFELSDQSIIRKGRREAVWELWDEASQWRIALRIDSRNHLGVYHWGDWYDYPQSYWLEGKKKGVDKGEPSKLKYAFHCLFGHHGIFSLTPVWIVAVLGALMTLRSGGVSRSGIDQAHSTSAQQRKSSTSTSISPLSAIVGRFGAERILTAAIVLTSIVVVGFYLTRPLEDRNYGGVCSGLRWSFWLIPLWFWLAVRGMERVKTHLSRWIVILLLLVGVFSAHYPWRNPWTSPWIDQWLAPPAQEY